ncbi:MAG: hypothetical protein MAG451_02094 [Anaerolineales bacterium]|nr:hypothetical protein [Anaerolineales bacterium]
MLELQRWFLGLALSAVIGGLGYRSESLSSGGVLGAVAIGTIIFGAGGWVWGILLIVFFASSSLLSRYREDEKAGLSDKFAKVGRRDLSQALANGGWGAILALAFGLWQSPILFVAFTGAMATVNADTWATELGVLSRRPPRCITTGDRVPPGTSGAISLLGTAAALAGALLIGLSAEALQLLASDGVAQWTAWVPLATGLGGLTGTFFDSLLGASFQQVYWCDECHKETERSTHSCGTRSRPLRGWSWLDNDAVNFLSSMVGSGITASLVWAVF